MSAPMRFRRENDRSVASSSRLTGRLPPGCRCRARAPGKAAEEMQSRVTDLLLRAGVPPARPARISTFHSLCARLLRREAIHAGLPKDFAIYDDDDQIAAVKLAMGRLRIEEDGLTPRNVLSRISYAKNHGETPATGAGHGFGAGHAEGRGHFREVRRLTEEQQGGGFRRPAAAFGAAVAGIHGCAGTLAGKVCVHSCGRISGHEPRAV